ncbi:YeeE/YedE thiosulfate transporter family protein [Vibrio comitans]|nr:YeeE/YedE thiosulfate transporter family protein [Vibrio comitans]
MLYLSLVMIGILGYLAQTTGLCMVRGVKKVRSGSPMFLIAIIFSGTLSWLSIGLIYVYTEQNLFTAYLPSWHFAVGGFLFGLGAAFNQGCGVSTISRLARGQLVMLATIAGWIIAWIAFSTWMVDVKPSRYEMPVMMQYGSLIIGSILLSILVFRLDKTSRTLWLSMLSIGFMGGCIFVFEPHWTPSGLLKDVSFYVWSNGEHLWPSLERFMLIACLVLGMLLAAIATRSFHLEMAGAKRYFWHLGSGCLMGFGAVLAGRGNDTQLLVALPALSPAGAIAVSSIIAGIFAGGLVKR